MGDPALHEVGRIFNGADITADAGETLESASTDLLFRGLRLDSESDEQAVGRGCLVMDSLYAAVKQPPRP